MASICATAPSLWPPISKAEGSLKAAPPSRDDAEGSAGEGVIGAAGPAEIDEGPGAGGAAGVDATVLGGVDGGCEGAAVSVEGAFLGCQD